MKANNGHEWKQKSVNRKMAKESRGLGTIARDNSILGLSELELRPPPAACIPASSSFLPSSIHPSIHRRQFRRRTNSQLLLLLLLTNNHSRRQSTAPLSSLQCHIPLRSPPLFLFAFHEPRLPLLSRGASCRTK